MLPIIAWLAPRLGIIDSILIGYSTLVAQVLFLLYAIWQTVQVRDRFDWESFGGSILVVVALVSLYPALALTGGIVRAWGARHITPRILDS